MFVIFQNLSPKIIYGFQHHNNILHVFLSSLPSTDQPHVEIKCVDAAKAKEILAFGIGACVRFYNVKVSTMSILVTATSGIRSVLQQLPHQQQKTRDSKSACYRDNNNNTSEMDCNCPNHVFKGVCFSCQLLRRQGPSGPLWLFKGLRGPPYNYETWNCDSCFARKNSNWNDHCWKCGEYRSAKKKRKQLMMQNAK
jgi:hypothetical protein